MRQEVDLMRHYPRTKRDPTARAASKTSSDRELARKFGKEFFDGDRSHGYGGFNYHPRFWEPVVPDFRDHFNLKAGDSILDVGCAKGFMLYDFQRLIPGLTVRGVDISEYAIENAHSGARQFCQVGDARELPFGDKSFDVVISITTLHNLDGAELEKSLREVERVARRGAFITVDGYRNSEEKDAMLAWNLTAKTILHTEEWKLLFDKFGYTGDYYWFMP